MYDARFIAVKRHYLAERVDRLGLLYYPLPDDDPVYVRGVHQRLARAHYFNHGPEGTYHFLGAEAVNRALNQCRVGLALSEEEGAMMACVQYLLAGLPVVTTPSRGGRHVWFEDWFAREVPPDPDAVRDAVAELAGRAIPPEEIRRATLERVQRHRQVFVEQVQRVYDSLGVGRSFAAEWDRVFVNGLVEERSHLRTLERIRNARS
jgi:glycosyltransferase involved in cell wall biosynthesis